MPQLAKQRTLPESNADSFSNRYQLASTLHSWLNRPMQSAARTATTIELLAEIFAAWLGGRRAPADLAMNRYFRARRFIGSKDRGAIAELAYFTLRRLGALEWWCEQNLAGYPSILTPTSESQDAYASARALVMAAILFRKDVTAATLAATFSGEPYAPSVLTGAETKFAAALEHATLDDSRMPLPARLNFPAWLEPELQASLGDALIPEMLAMQEQAPVDVRVNTLKTTREALIAQFEAAGFLPEPTPHSPVGIRLRQREALFASQMFKDGLFEMQDEGSQMVALISDASAGMRVIDFCAGAGGKTLALAAAMQNKGRILAWDTSPERLKDLPVRLRRAGVDNVEWKTITSESDSLIKRHKATADRVLVDAPCSGTGTWRRSPDLKWRTQPNDLQELLDIQMRILDSAARLVKMGGRLIYATCSMLKSENSQQVEKFLHRHSDFKVVCARKVWEKDTSQGLGGTPSFLWLSPQEDGTDGFFAAVLERIA